METWKVTFSYLNIHPEKFEAPDYKSLCTQVQTFADSKKVGKGRPPIGPLDFRPKNEWRIGAIKLSAFFKQGSRKNRFMDLERPSAKEETDEPHIRQS